MNSRCHVNHLIHNHMLTRNRAAYNPCSFRIHITEVLQYFRILYKMKLLHLATLHDIEVTPIHLFIATMPKIPLS